MNEGFKTKEKAEARLKEVENEDYPYFCPLINTMCRNDCLCFQKTFIYEDKNRAYPTSNQYYVRSPYCGNTMLGE